MDKKTKQLVTIGSIAAGALLLPRIASAVGIDLGYGGGSGAGASSADADAWETVTQTAYDTPAARRAAIRAYRASETQEQAAYRCSLTGAVPVGRPGAYRCVAPSKVNRVRQTPGATRQSDADAAADAATNGQEYDSRDLNRDGKVGPGEWFLGLFTAENVSAGVEVYKAAQGSGEGDADAAAAAAVEA